MSEKEQGNALVSSYQDIKKSGCAGSVVFSWQDEWFKRTWNTMANVDLTKTAYWSDFQTNEQFFGLMSFDPGEEESVCYTDGDIGEWSGDDVLTENGDYALSMKYDEKFIYFRVHKNNLDLENEKIYIPLDITPKTGSYYAEGEDVKFERQADFLLVLDGRKNSRVLVQKRYDVFHVVYSEDYGEENPFFDPPEKDSPVFDRIYMALQIGNVNAAEEGDRMSEKFETGSLTYGNGNPYDREYNSVSDFIVSGDDIEIRLPWDLLNFSNPSQMQVHDDYYENYGIENLQIDGIYAGIGTDAAKNDRIGMEWKELKGWGKNPTYHERLKQSYYMMQEIWNK